MKLNEAIVILENHNEWRRDKEVPNSIVMVDPLELGIAIDVVVSEVKKFNISGVGVSETELCECGKGVDKSYDPCCSLKCWHKMFTD
jgi:hypothetical protein